MPGILLPKASACLFKTRLFRAKKKPRATVASQALVAGMAVPALSGTINYDHGISTLDSPMNLVHTQRDYFGSHGHQLKHDATGKTAHTRWEKDSEIL